MKQDRYQAYRQYGFWIFFSLWFTIKQLSLMQISSGPVSMAQLDRWADYASLFLLPLALTGRASRRERIGLGLATAALLAAAVRSREYLLLSTWLVAAAAKDEDLDRLLRWMLAMIALTMVAIFALYADGELVNSGGGVRNGIPRLAMGYNHPNVLAMCIQSMAFILVYLCRERHWLLQAMLPAAAAAAVCLLTGSRASTISLALLVMVVCWRPLAPRMPRWARRLALGCMAAAPVVCGGASLLLSALYSPDGWLEAANRLLSGRIHLSALGIETFGIHALGAGESLVNHADIILDNSYVLLLLNFGVLGFGVYGALLIASTLRVARGRNMLLAGILAVYSIHATMEKSLLDIRFDPFLLLLPLAIVKTGGAKPAVTAQTEENT